MFNLDFNHYYFHLVALPLSVVGYFYQQQLTQLLAWMVTYGLLFLIVRSLLGLIFSVDEDQSDNLRPANRLKPILKDPPPKPSSPPKPRPNSSQPKPQSTPQPSKSRITFQEETVVLPVSSEVQVEETSSDSESDQADNQPTDETKQAESTEQPAEPDSKSEEPESKSEEAELSSGQQTSFWNLFFPSNKDSTDLDHVTGFQLYQEYFKEKYPEVDLSESQVKWECGEVDQDKYLLQADICNANLNREKDYRQKFQKQYGTLSDVMELVSELDQFKDYWLTQIYPKLDKKLKPRARQIAAVDAWTKLTRDQKRRFYYQAHERNQAKVKLALYPRILTGESLFANRHRAKHLAYLNKLEQEDREDELLKAWQKLPSKEREHYRQLAYTRASREVKQFLENHPDSAWSKHLGDKERTKYFNLDD